MWLYILSFVSREQSHSNKCKQLGPYVPCYFPPVPLLSRGFHEHILLPLCILLSLFVSTPPPPLFPLSVSLWKPIVKTWSFPPQCQCKRAPFAVMARPFGERERWVAPNGKHTVSPESVFEGLPRSSVLTQRLKGATRALCWMCDKKETKEKNWWAEWGLVKMSLCKLFYTKHTPKWVEFKVGSDHSGVDSS